jgi:hypothetical protein
MGGVSMDQTEIDEIIAHIHELRKGTSKQQEPIQKKEPEPVTDDISENLSDDDETFDDETTSDLTNPDQVNVTMMKPEIVGWTDSSKVTCDLCHSEIVLGKNLSGLVVDDEFFACEHCCQTLTRTELMDWTKSKMVSANSVRPIGLWVIEQQNENKSRMK